MTLLRFVDMIIMLIWNLAGSVDQNGDKDFVFTIRIQSASTGKRNEKSQELVPASLEDNAGNSIWHSANFEKMEKILNPSTGGMFIRNMGHVFPFAEMPVTLYLNLYPCSRGS